MSPAILDRPGIMQSGASPPGAAAVPLVTGVPGAIAAGNYYLSPVGNDGNDGLTPATPIRTLDQLALIVGAQYVANNETLTVNFANGTPPVFEDATGAQAVYPVGTSGCYDFLSVFPGIQGLGLLVFQGTRSYMGGPRTATPAGYTATIVSSSTWNGATQTFLQVTTNGGIDFTEINSLAGDYGFEIVGGPRDGSAYQFIYDPRIPELSAMTARCGGRGALTAIDAWSGGGGDYTVPLPGDVIRVYTLPNIPASDDAGTLAFFGDYVHQDIAVGLNPGAPFYANEDTSSSRPTVVPNFYGATFNNCIMRGPNFGNGAYTSVNLIGCTVLYSHSYGNIESNNSTLMLTKLLGGLLTTATTYLPIYPPQMGVEGFGGPAAWFIYDSTATDGYEGDAYVDFCSSVYAQWYLWFNDAVGSNALSVRSGSSFLYDENAYKPVTSGTANATPFVVGGDAITVAAVPFQNSSNGARIVFSGGG